MEEEKKQWDILDSEEFYELIQAYRHTPIHEQELTTMAFEAIKTFIRKRYPERWEWIKTSGG